VKIGLKEINFSDNLIAFIPKNLRLMMKLIFFKITICLVAVILISTFVTGLLRIGGQEICSCCDSKCRSAAKCQDKTSVCVCDRQLNVQPLALLSGAVSSYKLVLLDYLKSSTDFTYLYLPSREIFHPPKA
jgi:hypothetical protein